jgi:N-acetylglucosaminyl-diphospho-decaprenol L-rhamnosyltransferase
LPSATVIIPTRRAGRRLDRVLASLSAPGADPEVIVVDNASGDPGLAQLATSYPGTEVLPLDRNQGYSRAVNHAARRASGEALVLLNDDCVVAPGYVEAICAGLDPAAGTVMAAGVMCEQGAPDLIDTAGLEIDRTLLVFDYLNGVPVSALEREVPDPIGPSGGMAAFDRDAFLEVGGFDERLFAYWEDADLVLRLRLAGARCRLAPDARGVHEHSATLGSGSARKNYLMGFGRGYVLRKWGAATVRRLPHILARDLPICAGQAVIDRNLSGVRGRLAGYRAATPEHPYPGALIEPTAPGGPLRTLARRWRRRARSHKHARP